MLYSPVDRHATDIEILGNGPVSTAQVCCILLQRLFDRTALKLRHLCQITTGADHDLQAFDEALGSKVNLLLEVEPGARFGYADGDKPPAAEHSLLSVVGECAQQPVGGQCCNGRPFSSKGRRASINWRFIIEQSAGITPSTSLSSE